MRAVLGVVSSLSGFVYVCQVVAQVRLYGWRRWWAFGLGTGVEVHMIEKLEEELADG